MEKALQLPVVVGQFPLTLDLVHNLHTIQNMLQQVVPGELVILPEGALSGYADDLSFLKNLDIHQLDEALDTLSETVMRRQVHCIVGSCLWEERQWWNTGIYFSPTGQRSIYRKVNLATHERNSLSAGTDLPVFSIPFEQAEIKVGIQLCREIRYPEQWRYLAMKNIDLFVYLTNAINPTVPQGVWRSHLVSRAAENQRFLVSANVTHVHQHCPTMIIAPTGETLREAMPESTVLLRATLDLQENANWYLDQCRTDVVALKYKPSLRHS